MATQYLKSYSELTADYRRARPGSRARLQVLAYLATHWRARALADATISGSIRRYLSGQL